MDTYQEKVYGNGFIENGHYSMRHTPYQPALKVSLAWLDLRVFYVRVNKCEVDDSTPEFLTLNHIPLNRDTLLEVNGVRTSYYSDGVSVLLRRDRLDKKSEEVTFVSTDSIRMTGSVKFEVLDKDILVLSGVLELCHSNGVSHHSNGLNGESKNLCQKWKLNCETDLVTGNGFLRGKQNLGVESDSPAIEVCLAGSFAGNPIILTKNLQLGLRKKQTRKGKLESIPEYEDTDNKKEASSEVPFQVTDYPNYKPGNEDYSNLYSGMEYFEGEDGELTWFNAGVRVGVGIGLSVCLGIGIGVGLLVRTYQGTTRNFRRRLL